MENNKKLTLDELVEIYKTQLYFNQYHKKCNRLKFKSGDFAFFFQLWLGFLFLGFGLLTNNPFMFFTSIVIFITSTINPVIDLVYYFPRVRHLLKSLEIKLAFLEVKE